MWFLYGDSELKSVPLFDGRFNAYKLEAKNNAVLFASCPRGTPIPPHQHVTDNYGVITRGELILIMNGEQIRYGVGEWYHVPPNMEHASEFEVDTDEIEFWFENDHP